MNLEDKNALRKAITSHPQWDHVRKTEGFSSDNLSVQDLRYLATRFGITLPTGEAPLSNRPTVTPTASPVAVTPVPTPQPPMVDNPPVATPVTPTPASDNPALEQAMKEFFKILAGIQAKPSLDVPAVIALIKEHSASPATVNLVINTPLEIKTLKDRLVHVGFPLLLAALATGVNVMLVGPAGSGKTMAAEQVAKVLDRPFYFTGAIDSSYKLSGFIDAQGRIICPAFRKAYENGGVFLFDEMDASAPAAVLAFNAALANGHCDFPDGIIPRHESFLAIAACNTYGLGASRQYVGRNQQDAASLDRFVTLDWNYDINLERAMIGLPSDPNAPTPRNVTPLEQSDIPHMIKSWHKTVTSARAKISTLNLRHIVSPRSTLNGIKLLAAGWSLDETLEGCIYKGMDADTREKIGAI